MFYSYTGSEQKNMFVRFHTNKCSKSLLNNSLNFLTKRHMGLSEKREKKERRRRRKNDKKREMRIKIAHDLTKTFHVPIGERYVSRSIIKFVYPSIHYRT